MSGGDTGDWSEIPKVKRAVKIGLFGGTFDPIHIGHLIIAEEVRRRLEFDKIIFMPARRPWLKAGREIADERHRLAMTKLATASNPFFEVSSAELDRPGVTYTVDTVEQLKSQNDTGDEIFFIAGSDALADFPRWKEPERVVKLCQIVGVGRPGSPDIDVQALESTIPDISECLRPVDVPQIDISSTAIRERIKAGRSIRYLVPAEVEAYIHEQGLYT